jgi:diguanylate cyclase (GGDEF)-like protein/PAS domain S-box-containing protein
VAEEELAAALRAVATARPDVDSVFALTARVVRDVLDAPSVVVAVVDGDRLVARAVAGQPVVPTGGELPRKHSIAGHVIDTGQATLCVDGWVDERTDLAHNLAHGTRSSVIAPLLYAGDALGCVCVLSPRPGAFGSADVERLTTLADVGASRLAYALSLSVQADIVARLDEETSRLAAAQRLTGLATWSWDYATGAFVWDEQMYRLAGLEPWSVTPTFDLLVSRMHPDDAEDCRRLGDEAVATGRGYQNVFRVVDDDGTVRHLLAWTEVLDGLGGPPSLRGVTVDVSDRARATALATLAQARFRAAFDDAQTGMVMVGLHAATAGRVLRVNAAFCGLLGLPTEGHLTVDAAALIHPDERADHERLLAALTAGQSRHIGRRRLLRTDGSTVTVWVTATVSHSEDGAPDFLIAHCVDLTDQLAAEEELRRVALTDSLTGLANRQLLTMQLLEALTRAAVERRRVGLLMADLDQFKLVNDTLGHQAGDRLLVEVAHRLRALCPPGAVIGRPGGDEFLVLLPDLADPADAERLAQELVAQLAEPYRIGAPSRQIITTVSVGVATATPAGAPHDSTGWTGEMPDDAGLYRQADLALYRAKSAGRNGWAVFDDTLRDRAEQRLGTEQVLRRAINEARLTVAYQPVLDLSSGQWSGCESLVRLADPQLGELGPGHFIDVAEETGLIIDIDRWMLATALHQLTLWQSADLGGQVVVAVNVSARTIGQPGFVDEVAALLAATGLRGRSLRLELTERVLLEATPTALDGIDQLARLGVRLGLDDFGTGYSALAYLPRFPLTFLKVDQSFTARIGQSQRDDAVVSSIITLGHAHGLRVVAEGVETPEQLQFLAEAGADAAQGYLLGRPMPAQRFLAHVQAPFSPEPSTLPVAAAG